MSTTELDSELAGAMHSPMAGDIHVSLARSISKAAAGRGPGLDKAHAALLDNLDEGEEPETTSLFSGRAGKRVRASLIHCQILWDSLVRVQAIGSSQFCWICHDQLPAVYYYFAIDIQ